MKSIATLPVVCCGPATEPLAVHERDQLAAQFKALADPTRVGIVNALASAEEVCVCNLTATFDLSQPTISHHLKILREVNNPHILRLYRRPSMKGGAMSCCEGGCGCGCGCR